ncbi:glycosyl hydrolase [Planctomycetaceae bacterium SH139]
MKLLATSLFSYTASFLGCLAVLAFPSVFAAEEQAVAVGQGSYSLVRPEPCAVLQSEIFKTADLAGPTPTNQWWSSLVWERYSQNMFPHPLAMVCHAGGLSVSYPGAAIVAGSGHIIGGGVSERGDIVIGHTAESDFPDARLAAHSQWFVTAEFTAADAKLRTTFGHGSPFVFCRYEAGKPQLRFAEKPIIWSVPAEAAVIGITVRGNHYGLFGARGSRWSGIDGLIATNQSEQDYCSIALLPDNQPETLAMFARHAHNHVVSTTAVPRIVAGTVEVDYQFVTQSMEGSTSKETLFALYPHQWKYSSQALTGKSYRSVRGEMKLAVGREFSTKVPLQGVLPMLPAEGIADRQTMLNYLQREATGAESEFRDTYWEGKRLGKLASLSGIAEALGETQLQQQFVGEIKMRLENWLTASANESATLFYYDANWGTLIGSPPSYGSDDQLNDHHFHYGYFIRAAAELARLQPDWAENWGPMVNLLVGDIASSAADDKLFPQLRCFDIYAGHSWASGHAKFADGNNQESSSESMNAWYAMMLWGEVTGNDAIRDAGIFLFNTERTAVEEYWFDVAGSNFPADYPHVAVGMVWGGKGSYETWFSAEVDCIHGINWLPFTPASIYLGRHRDYVQLSFERICETRTGGDDFNMPWGDLLVMFGALQDPNSAVKYLQATPECHVETGNSHAFMYHWIHTLDRLGVNDAAVTADHPFFNVYSKAGKRTYAVYNFEQTPRRVEFSDGTSLLAAPRAMTVQSLLGQ